jgi:hypothetical protein
MKTLVTSYLNGDLASRAVALLCNAGVAKGDVQVVSGSAARDRRVLVRGSFAGQLTPDDKVRTFAGTTRPRKGAEGAFTGAADAHRQGTFADTDRDELTEFVGPDEVTHTIGDTVLDGHLDDLGVPKHTREQIVTGIHKGLHIVIASVPTSRFDELRDHIAEHQVVLS